MYIIFSSLLIIIYVDFILCLNANSLAIAL